MQITESAKKQIELICNINKTRGIFIYVTSKGCNGYKYNLSLEIPFDPEEERIEVRVGSTSYIIYGEADKDFMNNLIIDFVKTNWSTEFTFINEDAIGKCGCGESFSFKSNC